MFMIMKVAYDFPSMDRCGRSRQKKDFNLITQQALQNDSFLKIKCEEEQKEVYISAVGSRGDRGPAPLIIYLGGSALSHPPNIYYQL